MRGIYTLVSRVRTLVESPGVDIIDAKHENRLIPRESGNDVRISKLLPEDKGPDGALLRHFDSIAQCLAAVKKATAGEVSAARATHHWWSITRKNTTYVTACLVRKSAGGNAAD